MRKALLAGAVALAMLLVPMSATAGETDKVPYEEDGAIVNAIEPAGKTDGVYILDYAPNSYEGRAGGTKVVSCSWDCAQFVSFPRAFEFYGQMYNGAYFSSNGLVNFEYSDDSYSNSIYSLDNRLAIAPYWEDMRIDQCSAEGWYFQDAADHMYFRFSGQRYFSGSCDEINFEMLLHDNGKVEFRYGKSPISWSARPTTGISAKTFSTADTMWATNFEYRNFADNTIIKPAVCETVPTTSHALSGVTGNSGWYRSDVTVSLSVDCNADATYYSVDGGATQTYGGPFSVSDGVHTVEYWSVASTGTEATKSTSVKVDTVAPDVGMSRTDGITGKDDWMRTPPSYTLSATDATSGVDSLYWGIDASPGNTYTGAFEMASEGIHSVRWNGRDVAGNWAPVASDTVKLDMTAPVSAIAVDAPTNDEDDGLHVTSDSLFTLSATDSAPWATSGVDFIEYAITGGTYDGAWTPYSPDGFTVTGDDGYYTVAWRAWDRAGNVEATHEMTVLLDNSGPIVDILTPYGDSVTSGPLTVDASTDASAVAWRYVDVTAAIEDATEIAFTDFIVDGVTLHTMEAGPWEWTWDARGYEPGDHEITVCSTDMLGNEGCDSTMVFVLPGQTTEQVLEAIWG